MCIRDRCGGENDYSAKVCTGCFNKLIDDTAKLKEAREAKDAHVMRPDTMTFEKKVDKKGLERLEIKYYDLDAQHLSEIFYINDEGDAKVFYYNFYRMHAKLPGKKVFVSNVDEAIGMHKDFRLPVFVIARKQKKYWKIREKIFI